MHLAEPPASFHRRVATHGSADGVRIQETRAKNTGDIAPQPFAARIGDERPIAVAIGGNDRVQAGLLGPLACERDVLIPDGFGVDGNEAVGTAERNHFGAEKAEDIRDDIAADGGMLVHPDAQPGEGVRSKRVRVALLVGLNGVSLHGARVMGGFQEIALVIEERSRQVQLLPGNGRFVVLEDFAGTFVEFDAVAIIGDVAAGHHDGGDASLESGEGQGGGRKQAAGDGVVTGIFDGAERGLHNARGAGAEVAADEDRFAVAAQFAAGFQELEKPAGVGVADPIGQLADETPGAAGAKFDAALVHQLLDAGLHQEHRGAVSRQPRAAGDAGSDSAAMGTSPVRGRSRRSVAQCLLESTPGVTTCSRHAFNGSSGRRGRGAGRADSGHEHRDPCGHHRHHPSDHPRAGRAHFDQYRGVVTRRAMDCL
jgi:hypothetical protein